MSIKDRLKLIYRAHYAGNHELAQVAWDMLGTEIGYERLRALYEADVDSGQASRETVLTEWRAERAKLEALSKWN